MGTVLLIAAISLGCWAIGRSFFDSGGNHSDW
jgi:hypothetical protein